MPIIESHAFLNTHERKFELSIDDVFTNKEGVMSKMRVKASATVQVSTNVRLANVAAEHLLHKPEEEIDSIARNILEGTVRTYVHDKGFYAVEKSIPVTQKAIREMAMVDLMSIGIEVIGLTIHEVR